MRRAGGGMSFGTIIFLVILYFVLRAMGIDMLQVLQGGGPMSMPGFEQSDGSQVPQGSAEEEEMKAFMATVLAETEDTWNGIFQASGEQYQEPKLVLFSDLSDRPAALPPPRRGRSIARATARSIST